MPAAISRKCWLGVAGLCATLLCVAIPQPTPRSGEARNPFVYTQAKRFEPLAWVNAADRFPAGAQIIGTDNRPLLRNFFASADPEVSFDARTLLFSGKRQASDPWQIWQVPVQGGEPVRITRTSDDCIRPLFLPGGAIAYARKIDGKLQIETSVAGGAPVRITYAASSVLPAQVLRDGRILFEGAHPRAGAELYAVYSDGSGVESLRCDHRAAHRNPRQLASGDVVFSTGAAFARFTPGGTQSVDVGRLGAEVVSPLAELASGRWLIALRKSGLHDWSPSATSVTIAAGGPGEFVQPVALAPRAVPPRHPSALHNRPGANLLCLNAYESPMAFTEGSIAAVRVYAQTSSGKPLLLGRTEVEADGSFFVEVPTERPLRMELVGRSGQTLAAEAGWFWMRRGEQRVCVGCHAGPERAPENRVPKILTRLKAPVSMLGATGGN